MNRPRGLCLPAAARRVDVDHRLVLLRAYGGPGRGEIIAAQREIHRFRRTAGRFRTRSSVPERKQDMAVRAHIDPRLSEQKVSARAVLRNGFRRRRNEDLLRAAAVMVKTLPRLGAEILLKALERHRQRGQDGNTQFLCRVGAEQIASFGERGKHHKL